MTVELALTLLTMVTVTVTLLVARRAQIVHERTPPARRPTPFAQPLGIEDADPMVLCPSCRCMGHHALELVLGEGPKPITSYVGMHGEVVEIFTWQSAAGTPDRYRRQCLFCEHEWWVRA